jgi:hypothetical protein
MIAVLTPNPTQQRLAACQCCSVFAGSRLQASHNGHNDFKSVQFHLENWPQISSCEGEAPPVNGVTDATTAFLTATIPSGNGSRTMKILHFFLIKCLLALRSCRFEALLSGEISCRWRGGHRPRICSSMIKEQVVGTVTHVILYKY